MVKKRTDKKASNTPLKRKPKTARKRLKEEDKTPKLPIRKRGKK